LESRSFVPSLALDSRGILAVPNPSFTDPQLCLYRVPEDPAGREMAVGCAGLELPSVDVVALD
jgi:hypothetical protein